jgi:hypothetical protein
VHGSIGAVLGELLGALYSVLARQISLHQRCPAKKFRDTGQRISSPIASSARQKHLKYRTESLRCRTLLPCAKNGREQLQQDR